MSNVQIKSRYDSNVVVYECEHPVGSTHRKEYEAAILMCEAHAALWTPKSVEA